MPIFLPQFHEIDENNKFWGKGFTDWVNVKKNKPLFAKHPVPDVPFDSYFYDLSKASDMNLQIKKLYQYNLDGFIFYHYWFSGKPLLDKPIKNYLKIKHNKEFLFSWANESWTRAWDGLEREVLIKQNYGGETEWENHFNHCLQYFKDDRYTKIENKPVYIIYNIHQIPNLSKMLNFWNHLAKKNGFDSMYFIKTIGTFGDLDSDYLFDSNLVFEPLYSMYNYRNSLYGKFDRLMRNIFKIISSKLEFPRVHDYKKVSENSILNLNANKKIIPCCYVEWDNSARKKKRSDIIRLKSFDQWRCFHDKFWKKCMELDPEIITYNAWNEWAEGAYIDASEKFGFKVLNEISKWKER